MQKWGKARADVHPDSDEETPEQKQIREMEDWKANQLMNGAAQNNPNFVPVASDWKEKLQERKKAKKAKNKQQHGEKVTAASKMGVL